MEECREMTEMLSDEEAESVVLILSSLPVRESIEPCDCSREFVWGAARPFL